jgi:gamma-glutamyltranspeptidase/glutathione hydrolase
MSRAGLAVLPICALVLAACGFGDDETLEIGPVEGFAGLVAADEPRAALVGRDILANGGNAADAAVAMYFTMAVTLPSRASLGGGGVCLAFDGGDKAADLIEFLPRRGAGGGVLPLGVRAMAVLHARQGLQRWEELVIPAENLARFGSPISRAFAQDLASGAGLVGADPELSRIFAARGLPREGDRVAQIELSAVLAGVRAQGAGYFYGGPFTRRFAEAAGAAGQRLDSVEMGAAVPAIGAPGEVEVGDETLYFSLPPAAGGLLSAQLWQGLAEVWGYGGASEDERPHLFVEAAMRVFAGRADWLAPVGGSQEAAGELLDDAYLGRVMGGYDSARHSSAGSVSPSPPAPPEDPDGAGFVAGDRWGNAAACSLTMNGLFGAGRIAPGTGIVLAKPPGGAGDGSLSASVALLANTVAGDGHLAVAASGGAAAPTALAVVLLGRLLDGQPLDRVVAAARLHHGGAPDEVRYEPGVAPEVLESLRRRGHQLREIERLGRVNAFHCLEGLIDSDEGCEVASDPRGRGLATRVE